MTQDTRKDRRVKILSLNVRYKSATVDEFIENHAHDVSRGGIYIKTASPFPSGTLLKFEIRLSSDQAVISGVGRVVWKRDTTQGTPERPAGMGVKFIKVDDPSKAVIDRLVQTRADAGRSFDSENATTPGPSPRPSGSVRPITPLGLMSGPASSRGAGSASEATGAALTAGDAAGADGSDLSAPNRRATAIGIGAVRVTAKPFVQEGRASVPVMFPRQAKSDAPREGLTVMKQAAELLEEALREAGGSMDEVGVNPLFGPATGRAELDLPRAAVEVTRPSTPIEMPGPPLPLEEVRPRASGAPSQDSDAARARDMAGAIAPSNAPFRPIAAGPLDDEFTPRKSNVAAWLLVVGLAAVAGVFGFLFKDQLFQSSLSPPADAQQTVSSSAEVDAAPSNDALAAPLARPSDAGSASASGRDASAGDAALASLVRDASMGASPAASGPVERPRPKPAAFPRPTAQPSSESSGFRDAAASGTSGFPSTPSFPSTGASFPSATSTAVPTIPTATSTAVPTIPTATSTAVPTIPTATSTAVPTIPTATSSQGPARPGDDNPY